MSRKQKIEEEIKHEISLIILKELNDPGIGFATVTKVEISIDLKYAKIFVSALGDKRQIEKTFSALERAKGFIRKLLSQRMRIKFVPAISFKQDDSGEYSIRISKIIDDLKNENQKY